MLTLKIDGSLEMLALAGMSTFGEVMEQLSLLLKRRGRVITGITMNQQTLTGGRQFDYRNFPLSQVETLELNTANPSELAKEALDSCEEHLDMLLKATIRTTELFREGDDLTANQNYSRLIEGLRWLVKGLDAVTGMLKIDETTTFANGKNLRYYQNELLMPILDNLYRAQKDEDWVLLTDLLEYELSPVLKEWAQLINGLREFLSSK
jgi:hypothetical protein